MFQLRPGMGVWLNVSGRNGVGVKVGVSWMEMPLMARTGSDQGHRGAGSQAQEQSLRTHHMLVISYRAIETTSRLILAPTDLSATSRS